jgi:hypothetical protein
MRSMVLLWLMGLMTAGTATPPGGEAAARTARASEGAARDRRRGTGRAGPAEAAARTARTSRGSGAARARWAAARGRQSDAPGGGGRGRRGG